MRLLATTCLAMCLVHCSVFAGEEAHGESAEALSSATATGPITVTTDKPGTKLATFGFDIKQACSKDTSDDCLPPVAKHLARNEDWAKDIFGGSGNMDVIRIPIRADDKGVDANGHFEPGYYAIIVEAVKNARKFNPRLQVFASRNTVSDCKYSTPQCLDFASSLKDGATVVPWKYGRMVSEYLAWFDTQGIHVDILGLDNEPTNNEGNLTVARVRQVVANIHQNYQGAFPQLMLNDGSTPDVDFLKDASKENAWSMIDVAGMHYQSDNRERRGALDEFASIAHAHDRPVWDTEYHYTDLDGAGTFRDAARAVYGIFDQTDDGVAGLVWWAYHPRSEGTTRAQIESSIVETLSGASPLPTNDGDGKHADDGVLSTRAYRQGKDVLVWIVNDTDGAYPSKRIALANAAGKTIRGTKPTFEQWTRTRGDEEMTYASGKGGLDGAEPTIAIPDHSITVVRIPDVY